MATPASQQSSPPPQKAPVMSPTGASVEAHLAAIPTEQRRADAQRLRALMEEITGEPPAMWGGGIVGFGSYHYRYGSGHEGVSALASFALRKQHLVVYLIGDFATRHKAATARLGPVKTGKGCLYLKGLDAVDMDALRELIERSVRVRRGVDRAGG
jgi:hypothetical protein